MNPAWYVGWMSPVPITNNRKPVVSNGFAPGERFINGKLNYAVHLGVDIMFPRSSLDPLGPETDVALGHHGDPGFIAWKGTPIRAAGPGKIWAAERTALGLYVEIDHGQVDGAGMLTFYQHLDTYTHNWTKGEPVMPGTVLGTMGGDPANAPHLRHLHLEVWRPDGKPKGKWSVDPAPYLKVWAQI